MARDRTSYEMGWVVTKTPGGRDEAIRKANDILPAATAIEQTQSVGEGLMRALLTEFNKKVFDPEKEYGLIFNGEQGSNLPKALLINIQHGERNDRFQDLHPSSHVLAVTPDGVTELFNLSLAEIATWNNNQKREFFDGLEASIQEKKGLLPWHPGEPDFNNWKGFQTTFSGSRAYANKLIWNAEVYLDVKSLLTRRKAALVEESRSALQESQKP